MPDNIDDIKAELESQLNIKLYVFTVEKYRFIYRPLNIKELSKIATNRSDIDDLEDYFVESATLYPESFDFGEIKAGYVMRYAEKILIDSGFGGLGELNSLLTRYREFAETDIIHMLKTYILTAMPAYKEEDFDSWSMDEFARKAVLAEDIITIKQNINGIDSSGFKLVISKADGSYDESEYYSREDERRNEKHQRRQAPPSPPKQKKSVLSKSDEENLRKKMISMIREQNKEVVDPDKMELHTRDASSTWDDMTTDQLKGILGQVRNNDPIAARLHNN